MVKQIAKQNRAGEKKAQDGWWMLDDDGECRKFVNQLKNGR